MRRIIRWGLGILVCAFVAGSATNARCSDPPGWQSRTELEVHARQLDHRVIELQHAIMAARYKGDQDAQARAEADLKNVQAERVETLRSLGEILR
jgi:hypothetical protein